jgi:hypothetical protein
MSKAITKEELVTTTNRTTSATAARTPKGTCSALVEATKHAINAVAVVVAHEMFDNFK